MASKKVLELRAKNAAGKMRKVTIQNPGAGVTLETSKSALQALTTTNIFTEDGIDKFVSPVAAVTIETVTEDIYTAE
ncbi:TPA: DUF2922 domain-containing protein [Streptococcus suis]